MKRIYFVVGPALVTGALLGLFGNRMSSAQEPLKSGTVLQRTELTSAKGMEAILVLRELPPGVESGKHTQSGSSANRWRRQWASASSSSCRTG